MILLSEAIIPDEESKQKEKMPVVDGKKRNPDALTHTAKSVADAVAEATNTKKRYIMCIQRKITSKIVQFHS